MVTISSSVHHQNGNHDEPEAIINLNHGDPTMYCQYWEKLGDAQWSSFGGAGHHQSLSYFSNRNNVCWFLEPKLEEEIKCLHGLVGNAIVENRYVVVGTGSSQLIQAAFYALSADTSNKPVSVVSAAPYYSAYEEIADLLRSGLFKWGGDANRYDDKNGPYIEMVTSPNNPDGVIRKAVVVNNNNNNGMVVHDLAYYWPQYTAITSPADHDIMLFTLSKFTGHAGSRIGWALVKDKEVAKKMVKFIEINTIGVSKEAQFRAATLLQIVSGRRQRDDKVVENFFEFNKKLMVQRWTRLRDVVNKNDLFYLTKYPIQYCTFTRDYTEAHPAFAWMKLKEGGDCEKLFREHKIQTRSGKRFGSDEAYVRISMLSEDHEFDLFLHRLSTIKMINY